MREFFKPGFVYHLYWKKILCPEETPNGKQSFRYKDVLLHSSVKSIHSKNLSFAHFSIWDIQEKQRECLSQIHLNDEKLSQFT